MDDSRLRAEAQIDPLEELPIDVIVRKATGSDRPAIAEFIKDAYGDRAPYKATPRWTWQFIDNPFAHERGDEIPVWVAVDGNRIVGQIAVQAALLDVQGETVEAGWAVDIMILRSHRGTGIGHRLHEAVTRDVDVLLALTMSPASRRMAERQGCVTLAEVKQLTRWVTLDPAAVRRYLLVRTMNHRWARVAARFSCAVLRIDLVFPRLANAFLRLRRASRRQARAPSDTSIVEIDRFGPEVDELWERTRGDFQVIFPRDSRFLNWRFVDCPGPTYRCFVAWRDGQVVGYLVLRRAEAVELPQGIIADLYASRTDLRTVDALVLHSLGIFGTGVSAVDCGTSVPEFEAALRSHGFFRTRTYRPTCVCRDEALRERIATLREDWFLSKGDHDWDQIHVADPNADVE